MRMREIAAVGALSLLATGCVARTHEENAALRSTWPLDKGQSLAVVDRSGTRWPSVAGDILRGTSPEELAKERASVSQPLTEALAKP